MPDSPTPAQRDTQASDGPNDGENVPNQPPRAPRPMYRSISPPPPDSMARKSSNSPPGWLVKAACTHMTMARIYVQRLICDNCHRVPQNGWLYVCTQDKEIEFANDIVQGSKLYWDDLGEELIKLVKLPTRGPENRTRPFELLKEMSPQSMAQYTPEQLKILLEQREKLKATSLEDAKKAAAGAAAQGNINVASMMKESLETPNNDKPWILPADRQCNFKVCHNCRYHFSDRSFLSLDAIVNGDIPATAAMGFGFHFNRERPIADANIVKNIGYRPVPWPGARKEPSPTASTPSLLSLLDILDEQFAANDRHEISDISNASIASEESLSSWNEPHEQAQIMTQAGHTGPGMLPIRPPPGFPPVVAGLYPGYGSIPSPAASALGIRVGTDNSSNVVHPLRASDLLIRPPWTPPPTPECWKAQARDAKDVEFAFHPTVHDGRSSSSLKTNQQVRDAVFSSHLPPEVYRPLWQDGSQDSNNSSIPSTSTVRPVGHSHSNSGQSFSVDDDDDTRHNIPYVPEEAYDVGLCLPFNQTVFNQARATPLPAPTPAEVRYFFAGSLRDRNPEHAKDWEQMPQIDSLNLGLVAGLNVGADVGTASGDRIRMEDLGDGEASPHGVALTEEAVELGTADVVTQV